MTAAASPAPAAPASAPAVFTIGGRAFVLLDEGSVEHDIYLTRHLRGAGLLANDGAPAAALRADASEDDNALAFICAIYDSGRTFDLLAGLLVDATADGVAQEWTPAMATTNAAFFARVRDRDSKQQLQGILSAGVAAFFGAAIGSRMSSRSSSSAALADRTDPQDTSPATSTDSATGATSSSSSSSTTPSAPAASDAGSSATP
ncbi:hypothetical protein [Roseisolibacter agri]|uniref:Uncharacterized protein n=1 Tax=Roseisolibacter agri TaxID=2014610 RepID=A0AA37VA43_9BACT|nr:hypothetical protein [Roseisolibacter agri]GLC25063.1 hypothetical protein rosag_15760 [Roseisolibacter agri]